MTHEAVMPSPEPQAGRVRRIAAIALLALAVPALLYVLRLYYPIGVDWEATFYPAARNWRDPYSIGWTFSNPPWIVLLLPHALLGLEWSNAINLCLNIAVTGAVIWRYKGGWQAVLLAFTSPVFIDLARTNNVDWIPLLAFLVPPMWGLPLLALKPLTLGAAPLIWWKRQRFSPLMFAPLAVIIGLSVMVWGTHWLLPLSGAPTSRISWPGNFAPWPIGIPLGLYMLWRAYRAEDEILAAAATPFLTPYFASYSIAPLMALLACKYRREAFYAYVGLWMFFVVENRRINVLMSTIT
jgi:hypothetical protein